MPDQGEVATPAPDRRTLLAAIEAAQRAPSVHNTQPWRWELVGDDVELLTDPDRGLPVVDPDQRELVISCGAVLHHLVVTLRAAGWAATVQRFPDPARPGLLARLSVSPTTPAGSDLALAAAVRRRQTDRRPFADWPVPAGWWHVLVTAAAVRGARLVVVESAAHRLVEQLAETASALAAAVPGALAETRAWSGRPAGAPDGVPSGDVPAGPDTGNLPRRAFAGAELPAPVPPLPAGDGAWLAVLATDGDAPLDHLRAGEALSEVVLHATVAGLVTHPVSEVVEVADVRGRLAEEVLGGVGVPQVLLRVGRPLPGAAPLPRTGRRPVGATVRDAARSAAGG